MPTSHVFGVKSENPPKGGFRSKWGRPIAYNNIVGNFQISVNCCQLLSIKQIIPTILTNTGILGINFGKVPGNQKIVKPMTQETAFEILKTGYNVYLTGPAGSGKTFLLNRYIDYLKSNKIGVAVTASTGIAATHMNGTTIHSWCCLGVKEQLTEKELKKLGKNRKLKQRLAKTDVLIIDEISMIHDYQLDIVDRICRFFKNPWLPFGGLQVVLSGDFFQLPPVSKNGKKARFVIHSRVWEEMKIKACYLDEMHRQKNDDLVGVLNEIRSGEVSHESVGLILSRENSEVEGWSQKPTRLFTHNVDVDAINRQELDRIEGKSFAYIMRSEGEDFLVKILKKNCLAHERLVLKKGAVVMFVKNNFDAGYVNGTLGVVDGFDESKFPIVKIANGQLIVAAPETWMIEEDGEPLAKVFQIPLRLAWAVTVHKSQGMSLDAAQMDLGKSFEYGMGYVALSRVRTLGGINILGFNEMALKVDPLVIEMDKLFRELSGVIERDFLESGRDFCLEKQREFVKRTAKVQAGESLPDEGKEKKVKTVPGSKAYLPWDDEQDELLKKSFESDSSVKKLAEMFQRSGGAIRSRLRKLGLVEKGRGM